MQLALATQARVVPQGSSWCLEPKIDLQITWLALVANARAISTGVMKLTHGPRSEGLTRAVGSWVARE